MNRDRIRFSIYTKSEAELYTLLKKQLKKLNIRLNGRESLRILEQRYDNNLNKINLNNYLSNDSDKKIFERIVELKAKIAKYYRRKEKENIKLEKRSSYAKINTIKKVKKKQSIEKEKVKPKKGKIDLKYIDGKIHEKSALKKYPKQKSIEKQKTKTTNDKPKTEKSKDNGYKALIDCKIIKELSTKNEYININSKHYTRKKIIALWVKQTSNGICSLCGQKAPFEDDYGNPYLEEHHIMPLSEGGDDSIENVVALCPNCHRKMHIKKIESDIAKLKVVAKESFKKLLD